MTPVLRALPDSFIATRQAMHAVAEHVLAPFRYAATGRIGLRATDGGFGTPVFDGRQARVEGDALVDGERRERITTLRAAGEFLGIAPGAPIDVYKPATPLVLDEPLAVDADAAQALGDWYAFSDGLLRALASEAGPGDDAGEVQLWPEHFDIDHPEPYLYVGPWDMKGRSGDFWNEPFGASLSYAEILEGADAAAFLRRGRELLR